MKRFLANTRLLTGINFGISVYFAGLYLLNHYRIDAVLIGVFRELLTFPFLVTEVFFLIYGIIHFVQKDRNLLFAFSLLILLATTVLTLGSFVR